MNFSIAARNAFCATLNTTLGATPRIRFYSGTRPANADTALAGNTVLGTVTLPTNPFGTPSGGQVALAADPGAVSAAAAGDPTWGSFETVAGVRVADFTVGGTGSGAEAIFNTATGWAAGGQIDLGVVTVVFPAVTP